MPQSSPSEELIEISRQIIQENFQKIHPIWVEHQLSLFINLRSIFGNDIDKTIILGIVGQIMFANGRSEGKNYSTAMSEDYDPVSSVLTNIESISLSSGIPRESVRRKVHELIDEGWLKRDSRGGLIVTRVATTGLNDATQIIFSLLANIFARMTEKLEQRDLAITGPAPILDER